MHPQFINWLNQQKYFMGSSLTWNITAWDNINWSWEEVLIVTLKR